MASRVKQDAAPPGGYGPIEYARKIKKGRLGGYGIFGVFLGGTSLAWVAFHFQKKYKHDMHLEMNDARLALEPFVLAERNRMFLRHLRKNRDEEKELMKNVEGWEVGKYEGDPVYWNQSKRFHTVAPEEYWMHNDWYDMYNRMYEKIMH